MEETHYIEDNPYTADDWSEKDDVVTEEEEDE